MVTRLAQHGPLANESLTWKWNRLTAPKFRSQNFLIPGVPVVALALGVERRGADGVLHDRVGGEQGEPLVLAPGRNRGHGSPRSAAGGMIAVARFPGNRAQSQQNCNVFLFCVKAGSPRNIVR